MWQDSTPRCSSNSEIGLTPKLFGRFYAIFKESLKEGYQAIKLEE